MVPVSPRSSTTPDVLDGKVAAVFVGREEITEGASWMATDAAAAALKCRVHREAALHPQNILSITLLEKSVFFKTCEIFVPAEAE